VFLKSIELFGFKSFADRSKLDFSPGITSLLGPNGCGKSNIVDAIKWVLGEQSIKTLRAGKMEDVIFNGTENRKKLSIAEVTLTISNEHNELPLEVPEISIKRRMYRSGESEYFINSAPVRLREVKELFYDTGIGKSSYSILEQGKIDQILSQRPEDRRYIFEEAAGITRYKQRQAEASRKLERTEDNLRQVQNILKEVRQTYDSRKGQARKAEQYRQLDAKIFSVEVELQLLRVQSLEKRLADKQDQLQCALEESEAVQEQQKELRELIDVQMEQMNTLSKERIDIQTSLHRMDESRSSRKSQLELLAERIGDLDRSAAEHTRRTGTLVERMEKSRQAKDEKQHQFEEITGEYNQTIADRAICEQTITAAVERITGIDQEIASGRDRVQKLERRQIELGHELQEITESIARELDAHLKASGYSSHARGDAEAELIHTVESLIVSTRGKAALLEDASAFKSSRHKELTKQASEDFAAVEEGLSQLKVRMSDYFSMIPKFLDEFLSPAGIMTKKRQIDQASEETYRQQDKLRQAEAALGEQKRELTARLESYRQTLEEAKISEVELKGQLASLRQEITELERGLKEDQKELERSRQALEQTREKRELSQARIEQLNTTGEEKHAEEQQLRLRMSQIQKELQKHSTELESRRAEVKKREDAFLHATQRIERSKAEMASAKEEISYIYESFEENYAKSLHEFRSSALSGRDEPSLRSELKRLKQQVSSLGYINHMAAEEFSEVEERYDFLRKQLKDLEQAKEDLHQVTREITSRCEVLFEESYSRIKKNFHVMFRRLFGGGRAELRLIDPNDMLNTGIDILAQPPGKKLEKISLLSGGERSMTAVALMFATYLVKPSPFCILDEIDAALDDANIGYFLDILQEFSANSQFVIITHNKKTVLGSASMLGVTMQEAGVSKVIAYRLDEKAGGENHL
jgi:chromosome segregation protein